MQEIETLKSCVVGSWHFLRENMPTTEDLQGTVK
jgi:hypothetical protein